VVRKSKANSMVARYQITPKVTRLIVYGCSNTHGEELGDHYILNRDFQDINLIKQKFGSVNKFENLKLDNDDLTVGERLTQGNSCELNVDLSYAGRLAKHLGIEIISKAIPGNSQGHILYQIRSDWHKGLIAPTDLVLIGTTLANRLIYFYHEDDTPKVDGRTIDYFNHLMHGKSQDFVKGLLSTRTRESFVFDFYNDLINTQNFCQSHDLQAVMVPTTSYDVNPNSVDSSWLYNDLSYDSLKLQCIEIWKQLRSGIMITDLGLENFGYGTDHKCGFGHFNERNHIEYAEHLSKIF